MHAVFAIIVGWQTLLAAALPDGAQLSYSGTLTKVERDKSAPVKSFQVIGLVIGEAGNQSLLYQVEERGGGGGWAWPERFGNLPLSQSGSQAAIQILHTHEGTPNAIPIRRPVFEFPERLKTDENWTDGQLEYVVGRQRKLQGRDCWPIEVASANGRHQSLNVDAGSGVIVTAEQRVFMGRGEEFQLRLELTGEQVLTGDSLSGSRAAGLQLVALQTSLARKPDPRNTELLPDQLGKVREQLAALQQAANGTVWSRLVETITRDVQQQGRKQEGLAGLEKKFVGQEVRWSDLALLSGKTLPADELKGKVVVLQLWEYNGDQLLEPYGQVGYLDFLSHQQKKRGVRVVGVAVDIKGDKAAAAKRSARKLKEFMNLSYDIAVDDGTLLELLGDPRSLGAALPLWIVVDGTGHITHYKVGLYDLKPDEGLRQLDEAVLEALRSRAPAVK